MQSHRTTDDPRGIADAEPYRLSCCSALPQREHHASPPRRWRPPVKLDGMGFATPPRDSTTPPGAGAGYQDDHGRGRRWPPQFWPSP